MVKIRFVLRQYLIKISPVAYLYPYLFRYLPPKNCLSQSPTIGFYVLKFHHIDLGEELFRRKVKRKLETDEDRQFVDQIRKLLDQAPISAFFKRELIFEAKLEAVTGWTAWSDEIQGVLLKDSLGISLKENKYGIFDPDLALDIELNYFLEVLPLLRYREEKGLGNGGVLWREWEQDLMRRGPQKQ